MILIDNYYRLTYTQKLVCYPYYGEVMLYSKTYYDIVYTFRYIICDLI